VGAAFCGFERDGGTNRVPSRKPGRHSHGEGATQQENHRDPQMHHPFGPLLHAPARMGSKQATRTPARVFLISF